MKNDETETSENHEFQIQDSLQGGYIEIVAVEYCACEKDGAVHLRINEDSYYGTRYSSILLYPEEAYQLIEKLQQSIKLIYSGNLNENQEKNGPCASAVESETECRFERINQQFKKITNIYDTVRDLTAQKQFEEVEIID